MGLADLPFPRVLPPPRPRAGGFSFFSLLALSFYCRNFEPEMTFGVLILCVMQMLLDNFGLGFAVIAGLLLPPAIAAMLLAIEEMPRFTRLTGQLIASLARKFRIYQQRLDRSPRPAPDAPQRHSMPAARSSNLSVATPRRRRPGMGARWKSQNRLAMPGGVHGAT